VNVEVSAPDTEAAEIPATFAAAPGETDESRRVRRATESREKVLADRPPALGAAWARALCEGMQSEGRAIEGGWPGTVVEARARVSGHLSRELARRRMAALTAEELSRATDLAYSRARRHWLELARRTKLDARRSGAEE
jgi:hypothetical protein